MATGRLVSFPRMELHKELRQLRIDAGLTQVQLAALIGVQQPTISGVERGDVTTNTLILSWVKACKGQITVIPAKADPWQGIPESFRPAALEVARLWCLAPEAIRVATVATLRHFGNNA